MSDDVFADLGDKAPNYQGAVIDVSADTPHIEVTLYYDEDMGADHFRPYETGARAALLRALMIIEEVEPGTLNEALSACRQDDTHNSQSSGIGETPADVRE